MFATTSGSAGGGMCEGNPNCCWVGLSRQSIRVGPEGAPLLPRLPNLKAWVLPKVGFGDLSWLEGGRVPLTHVCIYRIWCVRIHSDAVFRQFEC